MKKLEELETDYIAANKVRVDAWQEAHRAFFSVASINAAIDASIDAASKAADVNEAKNKENK